LRIAEKEGGGVLFFSNASKRGRVGKGALSGPMVRVYGGLEGEQNTQWEGGRLNLIVAKHR